MAQEQQWYYQVANADGSVAQSEAVTQDKLYELLCNGGVTWETICWSEGMAEWTAISEVQQLRAAFNPDAKDDGVNKVTTGVSDMSTGPTGDGTYQAAAKKTVDELNALDANDESLQKYKAQLMGTVQVIDASDPRFVFLDELRLIVPERPQDKGGRFTPLQLADLKAGERAFTVKEGATYALQVRFRVQRDIVAALKFNMKVGKMGLSQTQTYMMGSYAPKGDGETYTFQTDVDTAPDGFLGRGSYQAAVTLTDDDKKSHGEFAFSFKVGKKWE